MEEKEGEHMQEEEEEEEEQPAGEVQEEAQELNQI